MAWTPLAVDLPSCVILCPYMSSSVAKKLHFEGLNCPPYLFAVSKTNR